MDHQGNQVDITTVDTQPQLQEYILEVGLAPAWTVSKRYAFEPSVREELEQCYRLVRTAKTPNTKRGNRKEASATNVHRYQKQFREANTKEVNSCIDRDVYELVDMKKS